MFAGWNTRADGKGTTFLPGASVRPTSSLRLYAHWRRVAQPQVRVTPLPLPSSIQRGRATRLVPGPIVTNAGQKASVQIRCRPLTVGALGDLNYCTVVRRADGSYWVRVNRAGPTLVSLRLSAPAVSGFRPYLETHSWVVR